MDEIRKSLVAKTTLLFMAAALFPYLLTSLFYFNSSKKALFDEIVKGMKTRIRLSRDALDAKLFLLRGNATAWAGMEVMNDILADDVDKRISNVLEGLKRDYRLPGKIVAVNEKGKIVASSNPLFTGKTIDVSLLSSVFSGKSIEMDVHKSEIDGIFVISFAAPVRSTAVGTKVIGALLLECNTKDLIDANFTDDIPFAAVIDRDGGIIASSRTGPLSKPDILASLKKAEGESVLFPPEYIVAAADSKGLYDFKGFDWEIAMAVKEENAMYPIRVVERVSIAVSLMGMALILGLVTFFASRTIKPLKELSRTADYMARTKDLSVKATSASEDEVGILAAAFNHMVDEVKLHVSSLQMANMELLEVLGNAIAKRDSDTSIHNYRVTIVAIRLAESLGLEKSRMMPLIKGSFLHDVGKIGISDNILNKPGRLTFEEYTIMKNHVKHGMDIISSNKWLSDATDVVMYHHEKFDGSGYTMGLAGKEIPLNARIFAIADVFDALTSERPYKNPLSLAETMYILEENSGSHFDPELLEVFKQIAEPVYKEITTAKDAEIEEALDKLIEKYLYDN